MQTVITETPPASEAAAYEKLLKKLFPTRPLYIFLAVSLALLVLMVVQHIANPASRSLVFISISLLCLFLGGAILRSTKKSLPIARARLEASLGKPTVYTFTDAGVGIASGEGEAAVYPWDRLVGQYSTDTHYVFCLADKGRMTPVVIRLTADNLASLNAVVQKNTARGIKMKKLKVK